MPIIGLPAPQFSVPAVISQNEIKTIDWKQFQGQWVVLFFYPFDFSELSALEIKEMRQLLPDFKAQGCEVLGVSIDSSFAHVAWIQELGDLGFPLLSDITKNMSRDYDAILEEEGVSTRATYIIDPKGLIQYISLQNLQTVRNFNEVLRVLKSLKMQK